MLRFGIVRPDERGLIRLTAKALSNKRRPHPEYQPVIGRSQAACRRPLRSWANEGRILKVKVSLGRRPGPPNDRVEGRADLCASLRTRGSVPASRYLCERHKDLD